MKTFAVIVMVLLTTISLSNASTVDDPIVISSYEDMILGPNSSRLGLDTVTGDVNGDGIDDIIMSQTEDPTKYITINNIIHYDYSVYVVYGNPNKITQDLLLEQPDIIIHHLTPYDSKLGHYLAAEDVNGDGIDDMVLGTIKSPTDGGGAQAGIVYVIYGNSYPSKTIIDLNNRAADLTILGDGNPRALGTSVATGDVNGDGINDIITSAVQLSRGSALSKVYVFYGKSWPTGTVINMINTRPDITIRSTNNDDLSASIVSEDVDNDNFNDIIIGANSAKNLITGMQTGVTYIVYGKNYESGTLIDVSQDQEITKLYGAENGDHFGSAIATGNIDNDAKPDIAITAVSATVYDSRPLTGVTYIVYGKNIQRDSLVNLNDMQANITIIGNENFGNFGYSLATGKINNDRLDDIIIGQYKPGIVEMSKAFVVYGKKYNEPKVIDLESENADITFNAPPLGDGFGNKVSSGDIDNDGLVDVVISAWLANERPNETITGAIYISYGKNFATFNPAGRPLPAQAQNPKQFNIFNQIQNLLVGFFFIPLKRVR